MTRFYLTLFCWWIAGALYAQTYAIESMEGKIERVRLSHAPYTNQLTVSYQRDTLYLADYAGLIGAHLLGKNFLEIVYTRHGGENAESRNTAIVTISHERLRASMVANSFSKGGINDRGSLFSVSFHLTPAKDRSLQLMANVHDEQAGEDGKPVRTDTLLLLRFDPEEAIFYSDRRLVARSLRVFEPGEGERKDVAVHEHLPVSAISDDIYYYYKGNWYVELMENNWSKLSFRNRR